MLKRMLVCLVVLLTLLPGVASAQTGAVILEDVVYGAVIGGILGGAVYLLDQDDFGQKLGTGVGVGALAGFVVGVVEVTSPSLVELEDGDVKVAMPAVRIDPRGEATTYSANLLKVRF